MGLFATISNKIDKAVTKVTNTIGSKIASLPVIGKVIKYVEKNPEVVIGIGVGSALKGTVTSSFAKEVPKIALSSATKTATRTAVTSAVAITGTSALISNPEKTIEAIAKTPSSVTNFLGNVGELAVNPSIEKTKETIMENPVIAGIVGAGIVAGVGKAVIPAIATFQNTQATKENTQASLGDGSIPLTSQSATGVLPSTGSTNLSPVATNSTYPLPRETKNMNTTRRKRKKTTKTPQISIKIDNRDNYVTGKRFK